MEWSISFTPRALRHLEELAAHLGEISPAAKTNLLAAVAQKLALIGRFLQAYPASVSQKDVRRCLINPRPALYYRVTSDEVQVIAVLDSRRTPDATELG
jgi:plasmid stabilization system protein ParE